MRKINEYRIIIEGPEWPDYWQGGWSGEYADVVVGIGDSAKEALEDALDILVENGWDVDSNAELLDDISNADDTDLVAAYEDDVTDANDGDGYEELGESPYVYASIQVK